jgi:hypothetical protein
MPTHEFTFPSIFDHGSIIRAKKILHQFVLLWPLAHFSQFLNSLILAYSNIIQFRANFVHWQHFHIAGWPCLPWPPFLPNLPATFPFLLIRVTAILHPIILPDNIFGHICFSFSSLLPIRCLALPLVC